MHLTINTRWKPNHLNGFISALSVDERHRGQGIGAVLLAFSETWFHSLGAGVCIMRLQ